jgi:protein phosphatase
MGGAAAGELASHLATSWIYEVVSTWAKEGDDARGGQTDSHPHSALSTAHWHFAQCLRHAVETANARLFAEAEHNPRLHGMGTTATVAGILDDTLYLAQIGDSRAYLVRQGTAYQLTHDQSRVQALVDAGVLTPEEAARSGERHIILQALGPEPEVNVDLTYQKLREGDVVVLSTDGLHDLVSTAEIAALAAPHQPRARADTATSATTGAASAPGSAHPDPATACQALVDLGNKRGGPDKITEVIIYLSGAELAEPQEEDIVGRQVVS